MSVELTVEQQNCVDLANLGHNFSLIGEAGTGKSLVVSEICAKKGKDVQVLCSTGIACEVYKGDKNLFHHPVTCHSFFGIKTAQGPFDVIVKNACEDVTVRKRILQAKCLIWDECSMVSSRVAELLHSICSKVRKNPQAFGGIQIILVGDWLQLKPVADRFDDGSQMFSSSICKYLFPHTIELTVVHRQNADESKLLGILWQIRLARCDLKTKDDIQSLQRPIDDDEGTVHLYFTNLLVDAHNTSRLDELPGERVCFTAIDSNDVRGIRCPAPEVAYFKEGSPVMVLYNINDMIHNGTRAVFLRKISDHSAVISVNGAEYVVSSVTWTNVDMEGRVIGSRSQMPLKLYWAATVHKSQGLTLKKAIIHSAYEFTGGLLYTALSRVRTINSVQVLNFKSLHVCKRDWEIENLKGLPNHDLDDCPCWRQVPIISDSLQSALPIPVQEELTDDDLLEIAEAMFEKEHDNSEGEETVSMEEYLEAIDEEEHLLSKLPEDFDVAKFLEPFKPVIIGRETEFVSLKNEAINTALQNINKFSCLIQIVWYKVYLLLRRHLKENLQETMLSTKEMKAFCHQAVDISRTKEYRGWLKFCLDVPEDVDLTTGQISLGFNIVTGVQNNFLHVIAEVCRRRQKSELARMNVRDMDSAGQGKLRFIGGWSMSRVSNKMKKYVRDNMYTENENTRAKVRINLRKIQLLEDNIIIPYDILSSTTKLPSTLSVTEVRQFRTHGLTHVSDEFFQFVLDLEQSRVDLLNTHMFKNHGEKRLEVVEKSLMCNKVLVSHWKRLFSPSLNSLKEDFLLIDSMYGDMIQRYVNVAANQFVKDFRLEWQVKKAMAHRQMVLARKEKKVQKEAKVPFPDILDDNSRSKERSHTHLKSPIIKFDDAILAQLYSKKELLLLQKGYGLPVRSSQNKALLGKELTLAIASHSCIPNPWSLVPSSQLQALPLNSEGHGLRIRRVRNQ